MDPITFWTAAGALAGIGIYILQRIRSGDVMMMKELDNKIENLYTSVQAKLDKRDHQIALDRIDKEIANLRADTRDDLKTISGKIDRLTDLIVNTKNK